MNVVIDGYPFRYYGKDSVSESNGYGVSGRQLRLYLISKFKTCYFCGIAVKDYPLQEGVSGWPPDDYGTVEHLKSRRSRKRGEVVEKVLACKKCNFERNEKEQSKKKKVNP